PRMYWPLKPDSQLGQSLREERSLFMKRVIVTMLFLSIGSVSASALAEDAIMGCGARIGGPNHSGLILVANGMRASGSVFYNYVSADLSCSRFVKYRIKNREPFRCAGIWDFDMDMN